jgi:hypothetical protein
MRRAAAVAVVAALLGAWPAAAAGAPMSTGGATPDSPSMAAPGGPDWSRVGLAALAVGAAVHGVREVRYRRGARP